MIFVVLLVFHWVDPKYPFFESITIGLENSLNKEAELLGRLPSIAQQHWESILNIFGFLVYIFFGIVGCLYSLSRKYANKTKVSFIFMLIVLFFVFFVFPLFGIRNIIPYRWPPFIYVSLVLFIGIGLIGFLSVLKNKNQRIAFVLIVLFVTSFFMITNFASDKDSPLYGKGINQKLVWTESEAILFKNVNSSYNGVIVTDRQTAGTNFRCYLKRKKGKIAYYPLTPEGGIRWNYMNNKLVIWRETSLTRPLAVSGYSMLLGKEFKNYLDENFSCIYNTGEARAYLGSR